MAIGTPVGLGTGTATVGATAVSLTLGTAIQAGDLVVVALNSDYNPGSSGGAASITDGTNTYTNIPGANGITGQDNVSLWYCANCAAVASGTIIATLNNTVQASRSAVMVAARVSGITTSPLDTFNKSQTSTATPTVSTGTLSTANQIVFGADSQGGLAFTYTPSTSDAFTAIYNNTTSAFDSLSLVYKIVSSTTSVTNAPIWNLSEQAPQGIASFKGANNPQIVGFNGTGGLSSSAQIFSFTNPAVFSGAGSLSASLAAALSGNASFFGAGSFSIQTTGKFTFTSNFAGAGLLSATPIAKSVAFATLGGTGSLSADLNRIPVFANSAFAGTGLLSADSSIWTFNNSAIFNGTGSLSASAQTFVFNVIALLPGAGSLSVSSIQKFNALGIFNGAGSLSASAQQFSFTNQAIFAGIGGLSVSAQIVERDVAIFAGSGSLAAKFLILLGGFAIFNGAGRMCAYAQIRVGTAGATTNIVLPGVGPTNNVVI